MCVKIKKNEENMAIDFDTFLDWAEKRFDSGVVIKGREICINSVFADLDKKYHLWCNPDGGKRGIKSGVFHCWKTDKKGTLISLVMHVDKCDKKQALEVLGLKPTSGKPIEEIDFDFQDEGESFLDVVGRDAFKIINMPSNTFLISKAPENWYQKCIYYLNNRKISYQKLFICISGKYHGRIIIPYYTKDNKLIYFNGRTIVDSNLRYRGPEKDIGVGKEDVLYFTNHPNENDKVYVCEGEFDAMSLSEAGFNAVACGGKNLSDKQASLLSKYKVCLALDSDDAGQSAINHMQTKLNAFCSIPNQGRLSIVRPPVQFKDWNELLCKHDTKILKAYIEYSEKEIESENPYGFRTTKTQS